MNKRIKPAPDGLRYPVRAWHTQKWKHDKPDLRREKWCCGSGNEMYACIEIDVPDDQVVHSDFCDWNCVLNDRLISDTKEENERQYAYYETISGFGRNDYREKSGRESSTYRFL